MSHVHIIRSNHTSSILHIMFPWGKPGYRVHRQPMSLNLRWKGTSATLLYIHHIMLLGIRPKRTSATVINLHHISSCLYHVSSCLYHVLFVLHAALMPKRPWSPAYMTCQQGAHVEWSHTHNYHRYTCQEIPKSHSHLVYI